MDYEILHTNVYSELVCSEICSALARFVGAQTWVSSYLVMINMAATFGCTELFGGTVPVCGGSWLAPGLAEAERWARAPSTEGLTQSSTAVMRKKCFDTSYATGSKSTSCGLSKHEGMQPKRSSG